MVIDDLKNFSLLNIINSLIHLIMINKHNFFLMHIQKITSGNGSDTFAMRIDDREGPVTVFYHNFLNIISEILSVKCNHVITFHNIIYRNTLIDQSRNIERIIR